MVNKLHYKAHGVSVNRIKGDACIGIEIRSKHFTEVFLFSSENTINYDDIQAQSKWISIVKDKKGNIAKTTAFDGV